MIKSLKLQIIKSIKSQNLKTRWAKQNENTN